MVFCYKLVNFQIIIINIRKTQKRIEYELLKGVEKKLIRYQASGMNGRNESLACTLHTYIYG